MVTPISNKAPTQNVLRNTGNVKSRFASSIDRLDSGKRILKASDGAVGLSISARFNSDIRALQKKSLVCWKAKFNWIPLCGH